MIKIAALALGASAVFASASVGAEETADAALLTTASSAQSQAKNMTPAPWAIKETEAQNQCTLIVDGPFVCIFDCNGEWVISDSTDCTVQP